MRAPTSPASRRGIAAMAGLGMTIAGLAGCAATNSTDNAVVDQPAPVAAAQQPTPANKRSYQTPDKLAIATQRLSALLNEQEQATQERSKSDELIATLKSSASCDKETKSCSKKLDTLTEERDRLDLRIKQLPTAISIAQARVLQLQSQTL